MEDQLKALIDKSQKILITSHISPDPDAIASSLLLSETLKLNFPDKEAFVVLEEKPERDLSFLNGYSSITFQGLSDAFSNLKPDLLIITDANNLERVSRNSSDKLSELISANHTATAAIDHHEEDGKGQFDVFINRQSPAVSQDIYFILFKQWGLNKPDGYEKTTMLGILSDTYRFKYQNPGHRETFEIVSELIDAGASIEMLENQLERYTKGQLEVFGHIASNINLPEGGYTYSFVSDDFTNRWKSEAKSIDEFKTGCVLFSNQFLRNVNGNDWGFLVYPDLTAGDNCYSVSFRSVGGVRDVAELARQLGGGGHKPAAAAKLKASNVDEVVQKVKNAVEQVR